MNNRIKDLDSIVRGEYDFILRALIITVKDLKNYIQSDPQEYTEYGCDEPSIDLRLCIDLDSGSRERGWIIRTGDSSYDPYHSEFCAASCVTLDTDPTELLEELLDQVMDQFAEREAV